MEHLPYIERLKRFGLLTLEKQQLSGNMVGFTKLYMR